MSDELNISRTRKVKMEKRFNVKNAIIHIMREISWYYYELLH